MSKKTIISIIVNLTSPIVLYLIAFYSGLDITSFGLDHWLFIFIIPILSLFQIAIVKIRFPWLTKIDDLLGGAEVVVRITCTSALLEELRKSLEKEMKVLICNETHLVLLRPSFISISQNIQISLSKSEHETCLIKIRSNNRSILNKYYPAIDFGSNYKNCLKIKRLLIK